MYTSGTWTESISWPCWAANYRRLDTFVILLPPYLPPCSPICLPRPLCRGPSMGEPAKAHGDGVTGMMLPVDVSQKQ